MIRKNFDHYIDKLHFSTFDTCMSYTFTYFVYIVETYLCNLIVNFLNVYINIPHRYTENCLLFREEFNHIYFYILVRKCCCEPRRESRREHCRVNATFVVIAATLPRTVINLIANRLERRRVRCSIFISWRNLFMSRPHLLSFV